MEVVNGSKMAAKRVIGPVSWSPFLLRSNEANDDSIIVACCDDDSCIQRRTASRRWRWRSSPPLLRR